MMKDNPQTVSLLSSLESSELILNDVTNFILHVIYNRPKKEKTPGDSRYAMLFTGQGKKRKFTPWSMRLPPDSKLLKCHIQRVNLIVHGMVNCLNGSYDQLDPLKYGWELENYIPVPIWYEGTALPTTEELAYMTSISNLSTQHSEPSTAVVPKEVIDFEFVDDPDFESDDDDGDHSTDNEED